MSTGSPPARYTALSPKVFRKEGWELAAIPEVTSKRIKVSALIRDLG